MSDGHLNKCIECVKEASIKNRIAKLEYYRSYDKSRACAPHRVKARAEYAKTEAGKIAHRRAKKNWAKRNEKQRKANVAVSNAIRDKRLFKQPCFICGEKAQAHHPDYDRHLDVVWLCKNHHDEVHRMVL